MKSVLLNAAPRSQTRHGEVKKLRATGRIPAVIYGGQTKPENLELNAREMGDLILHSASENILVDLAVKDNARPKRLALVQEVQHHPLSGQVLHVDFHEVAEDEQVILSVPVETTGEAVGVKTGGGVLEHVLFKIKVRALPKDLPEQIIVDVTALELGKSLHLGDIKAPPGVEILGDKKISVISVALPKTEEEEAAEAATEAVAAGDVEMIKEKKEGEEEGAAPAKGAKPGEKAALKPGEKAPAGKPGEKAAPGKPGEKAPAAAAGDKKAAAPAEKKK